MVLVTKKENLDMVNFLYSVQHVLKMAIISLQIGKKIKTSECITWDFHFVNVYSS